MPSTSWGPEAGYTRSGTNKIARKWCHMTLEQSYMYYPGLGSFIRALRFMPEAVRLLRTESHTRLRLPSGQPRLPNPIECISVATITCRHAGNRSIRELALNLRGSGSFAFWRGAPFENELRDALRVGGTSSRFAIRVGKHKAHDSSLCLPLKLTGKTSKK